MKRKKLVKQERTSVEIKKVTLKKKKNEMDNEIVVLRIYRDTI